MIYMFARGTSSGRMLRNSERGEPSWERNIIYMEKSGLSG